MLQALIIFLYVKNKGLYLGLPDTPQLMTLKLFSFFCCLLFSVAVKSQQTTLPGSAIIANTQRTDTNTKVYSKVEIEASFPGDADAWRNYLVKNLKANTPVKHKAPAGTYQVVVLFIVSKDGSIKDMVAETSHGYGMENEVIRIIKKGPDWIPASQDGITVNAYRRQPVTFVVSEK